ncbi:hypothetical protein B0T21DRAFT_360872 [Apiosordaria backusii]|uniref:Secreted protein n=1 Tax=Apiosordaria backusii TaxID=314023 RepID=A0AA40EMT1_9PEZI|nr:hypothetical protein B0T21DRAFT_360872 [Apiosordaria backusii]
MKLIQTPLLHAICSTTIAFSLHVITQTPPIAVVDIGVHQVSIHEIITLTPLSLSFSPYSPSPLSHTVSRAHNLKR